MKEFLDETCKTLNREWDRRGPEIVSDADELDAAIAASAELFEDGALFSVWREERTERRFNRAVFDIFAYYLSQAPIRERVGDKKRQARDLFRHLCTKNSLFLQSLQTTTKSLSAVEARFWLFGKAIAKLIGKKIKTPRLSGGHFVVE